VDELDDHMVIDIGAIDQIMVAPLRYIQYSSMYHDRKAVLYISHIRQIHHHLPVDKTSM
jgi:hypothetical protein